jgi:hypothetical protein
MQGRGDVKEHAIDQLQPAEDSPGPDQLVPTVFRQISDDPMQAARLVLTGLDQDLSPETLIQAARRMVFVKGNDSHDYKYSSAVLEDYYHVSPEWRPKFLAASVFQLCGAGQRDNPLVSRIRQALGTV